VYDILKKPDTENNVSTSPTKSCHTIRSVKLIFQLHSTTTSFKQLIFQPFYSIHHFKTVYYSTLLAYMLYLESDLILPEL